jgi:hypothetical protein
MLHPSATQIISKNFSPRAGISARFLVRFAITQMGVSFVLAHVKATALRALRRTSQGSTDERNGIQFPATSYF